MLRQLPAGVDWRELPCEEWQGSRTSKGYGLIHKGGGKSHADRIYAHRSAFIECFGPIEDTAKILHRCDNPPCRQPLHLYSGTSADNILDAVERGRWRNQNTGRESCYLGHPYTPENTHITPDGHRVCRTCKRAMSAKIRARKRGNR